MKKYKPKHSKSEYYDLIISQGVKEFIPRTGAITRDRKQLVQTFCCLTQHVYGYTPEHCLDKIYDAVQLRKKRIAYYKTLPTLDQLVSSNTKIYPTKMYYTKENGSYDDSCCGHSGNIILEMRDLGIDAYYEKQWTEFVKWCKRT